ncbi:MAG: YdeI/OmpD-associated family protein [Ignavibacteria bacterium]
MSPKFFPKQSDFRKWLKKFHKKETEIVVGFYKVGSGKPSMTWSESVDEALCFGWIDGIRKSIDDISYSNRFTPRREKSNWSAININKVEELKKKGLMHPAGLASYEKRELHRSAVYSYENEPVKLSAIFKKQFMTNKKAWKFFNLQAPYYQRLMSGWVMSAKQEETRLKRLEKLITSSGKSVKL